VEKEVIEIIWTNPAKNDLKDIYDYLSFFSEVSAYRVINRIIKKVEILRDGFLEIGQVEPLLINKVDVYRYLVEKNHKIIYKVNQNKVIVISVFDVRQNPKKLEEKVKS
jgi:plasmid stabilization system protein ParE